MHKIQTTNLFKSSFSDIVNFYKTIDIEIVYSLKLEISKIENTLKDFPEINKVRYDNLRRVNLKRFPFCIFYRIEPNKTIRLVKIIHQSRDPLFWP